MANITHSYSRNCSGVSERNVSGRVGISVSADIEYRPILTNIGKTDISVSVVALVPIYRPIFISVKVSISVNIGENICKHR